LLLTRKLLNQGFLLVKLKSSRSPLWLGWPLWNIWVTNDHRYVPLVVATSRSFSRSWLVTGFVTRLTRRLTWMFCRSLFVLLYFFPLGHCVVCSYSIYGFRLPLLYLQILLWSTHIKRNTIGTIRVTVLQLSPSHR
jgi:hypothetical protein